MSGPLCLRRGSAARLTPWAQAFVDTASAGNGPAAVESAVAALPHNPRQRDFRTTSLVGYLQIANVLRFSTQVNMARSGQQSQSVTTGVAWLDSLSSFRPWVLARAAPDGRTRHSPPSAQALECAFGADWSFTASSVCLLLLPPLALLLCAALRVAWPSRALTWEVALIGFLDTLYLPVTTRAIVWFNRDTTSVAGQVRVRRRSPVCASRSRRIGRAGQCVLRLAPTVLCDSGTYWMVLLILVLPTFIVVSILFPTPCALGAAHSNSGRSAHSDQRGFRHPGGSRPLQPARHLGHSAVLRTQDSVRRSRGRRQELG